MGPRRRVGRGRRRMSDWDKELKKIDKQLESMSDEALHSGAGRRRAPAGGEGAGRPRSAPTTSTLGRRACDSRSRRRSASACCSGRTTRAAGSGSPAISPPSACVVGGGVWSSGVDVAASHGARARAVAAARRSGAACSAAIEVLPRIGLREARSGATDRLDVRGCRRSSTPCSRGRSVATVPHSALRLLGRLVPCRLRRRLDSAE